MQAQALGSRMNMNRPIPVQRLVTDISDSKKNNYIFNMKYFACLFILLIFFYFHSSVYFSLSLFPFQKLKLILNNMEEDPSVLVF